jgi:hypothetical protein
MNHSGAGHFRHQHRRHLVSHGVGLGAASIGSFITSRARIGSTESTRQLTVSFGGSRFRCQGKWDKARTFCRVRWMSLERIEANRKTLDRTAAAKSDN